MDTNDAMRDQQAATPPTPGTDEQATNQQGVIGSDKATSRSRPYEANGQPGHTATVSYSEDGDGDDVAQSNPLDRVEVHQSVVDAPYSPVSEHDPANLRSKSASAGPNMNAFRHVTAHHPIHAVVADSQDMNDDHPANDQAAGPTQQLFGGFKVEVLSDEDHHDQNEHAHDGDDGDDGDHEGDGGHDDHANDVDHQHSHDDDSKVAAPLHPAAIGVQPSGAKPEDKEWLFAITTTQDFFKPCKQPKQHHAGNATSRLVNMQGSMLLVSQTMCKHPQHLAH